MVEKVSSKMWSFDWGEIEQMLRCVGFAKISVEVQESSDQFIRDWFPGTSIENHVQSAVITAYK